MYRYHQSFRKITFSYLNLDFICYSSCISWDFLWLRAILWKSYFSNWICLKRFMASHHLCLMIIQNRFWKQIVTIPEELVLNSIQIIISNVIGIRHVGHQMAHTTMAITINWKSINDRASPWHIYPNNIALATTIRTWPCNIRIIFFSYHFLNGFLSFLFVFVFAQK